MSGPLAWRRFGLRRLLRIVPVYWLLTLGTAFGVLIAPSLFSKGNSFDPWRLLQTLFLLPTVRAYVPVAWTLSFEMSFYILWTFSMFRRWARLPAFLLILVGGVSGLIFPDPDRAGFLDVGCNSLNLEFLMGVLLERLMSTGRIPRTRFCAAAFLASTPLLWTMSIGYRGIVFGVPAFLLAMTGLSLESRIRRLPRIVDELGEGSYSIYLLHIMLFSLWIKVVPSMEDLPIPLRVVGSLVFAVSIGWAFHRTVERPLIQGLRRWTEA